MLCKQRDSSSLADKKHEIHYYARLFNTDPFIIERLFLNKMITDKQISDFLFPSVSHFHDPFLLPDMKLAVIRIVKALKNSERVAVFGDYDADGIAGTSMLVGALRFFGAEPLAVIPTREEGYGLSAEAVRKIKETSDASLIVTVDNGSNAKEAIAAASALGVDVVVTDHHEIHGEHPRCAAFVNPKRSDSVYPFPHLAGAGVAFKLIQALFAANSKRWEKYLWDYVELAALGTVADLMPLVGENRVIAKLGIEKMNTQPSAFFKGFLQTLRLRTVECVDISFKLAPIINSTGRVADPNNTLRLICSPSCERSDFQQMIETDNFRRGLAREQFAAADNLARTFGINSANVLVVHGPFHEGIIGLLSARLTAKYNSPSIVIANSGKASARGVAGFSMIGTLRRCAHFFRSYGGHQAAAGFSIDPLFIDEFRDYVQWCAASDASPSSAPLYDARMPAPDFPSFLVDEINMLAPFGAGNPAPVFLSENTAVGGVSPFGRFEKYAKMTFGNTEAVSFNRADELLCLSPSDKIDFLYSVDSRAQLLIHDFFVKEKDLTAVV